MSQWHTLLSELQQYIRDLADRGCDMPFYRGHSDGSWELLCGLGRQHPEAFKKKNIESILYYDFLSLGGPVLGKDASPWDILFSMQHHGLPTRLLDWTTTFAVALYFAFKPYLFLKELQAPAKLSTVPCIWVLDPFELNRKTSKEPLIINPQTDLDETYQQYFIEESKQLGAEVLAINPTRSTPRLVAQRSVFTLHSSLFAPLEVSEKDILRKFSFPANCVDEAIAFLALAGVTEYSLFPDLDGLARHLNLEHVDWG